MWTTTDLIPWALALPAAFWELRNVGRRHGWILGACAGSIVFGGILIWVYVVQQSIHDLNYGALAFVQALGLLLGPLAAAVIISRRATLAAGVFAGGVVGFCVYVFTATIGIGIYGE
ncbi:hypothetical protein ATY81_16870 [Rhizobium sp. R72]|uniref:hypothetical protein n=1 Tax=unclassified Rhizobium TaxID=2613769 RepID=UPI000B6AD133|nr:MULTISPECIES: hypothetical protein [unclassified Rhizobium]OWV92819.1 hypothetical protein ATY81_16870 [Rhizobium sp. R72]OWV93030.1 hypothetical protein ATY80_16870 [Rhizobium sp. R711]